MFLTKIKRSRYYQLFYEVDGKRNTVSTKTTDIKDAQNFLNSFVPSIRENDKLLTSPLTITQFKDEYLNYARLQFSKSYVERSIKPTFKFLIEFAGDIPLKEIDLKTLDNFIIARYNKTKFGASLYYRTLKAAFSKAVNWNYLNENPLKKIKAPKVPKSNPVFITETELNLILNKTKQEHLKNIFLVAFYTGMRLAEILNMKSSWIDAKKNIITLKNSNQFTTKSKKERIIPIHPHIAPIVTKPKSNLDDFIFNRKAEIKFNEDYVSKQFK